MRAFEGQGRQALDALNGGQAACEKIGRKGENPFMEQGAAGPGIGRAQVEGHGFRHAVHTGMGIDGRVRFGVTGRQQQIVGGVTEIHGLFRLPAQSLE